MTTKELEKIIRRLILDGKGEQTVYFKCGPVSYPINAIKENVITSSQIPIIQFYWDSELIKKEDIIV